MTAVRHVDIGVMCNHQDCYDTRYAYQLDLDPAGGIQAVRAVLARQGWVSCRVAVPPEENCRTATRIEDYCPAHAANAGGTTDGEVPGQGAGIPGPQEARR